MRTMKIAALAFASALLVPAIASAECSSTHTVQAPSSSSVAQTPAPTTPVVVPGKG